MPGVLHASGRGESKDARPTGGRLAPSTLSRNLGNLGDPSLEGWSFGGLEVDRCSKCERREETAFCNGAYCQYGIRAGVRSAHDRGAVRALLPLLVLSHVGYQRPIPQLTVSRKVEKVA